MSPTRGPAPTPTKILNARGSWRAKTRSPNEPQPKGPVYSAYPPRWLSKEAKKIWKETVKHLAGMDVIRRVDSNALARYCTLYVQYQQVVEVIDRDLNGMARALVDEDDRAEKALKLSVTLHESLLRIESHFGLTPSARTRVDTTPAQTPDDDLARKHGIA